MTAERGDVVVWSEWQYLVAEVQGDLLVLDGRVSDDRLCRPRVTVLASDVTVVGKQLRIEEG